MKPLRHISDHFLNACDVMVSVEELQTRAGWAVGRRLGSPAASL